MLPGSSNWLVVDGGELNSEQVIFSFFWQQGHAE
jgi:hypothetical protein